MQGSVASVPVPSKWDKATGNRGRYPWNWGKVKYTSAPHASDSSHTLSSKAGKACGPGPGSSHRYAHERSQPLASFAGSWAREWSARSPFHTMMDQASRCEICRGPPGPVPPTNRPPHRDGRGGTATHPYRFFRRLTNARSRRTSANGARENIDEALEGGDGKKPSCDRPVYRPFSRYRPVSNVRVN